jgi:oligosaccharide repeat unit polymerase
MRFRGACRRSTRVPLLVYFALLLAVSAIIRRSPALLLATIYVVSLACAIPLQSDYELSGVVDVINVAFVAAMLTLLIVPWRRFPYRVELAAPNERRVLRLTWVLLAIHAVGLVVFSTAFYEAITTVTDYSAFKSGGGSGELFGNLPINHTVFLLSTYLNTTAMFLIPLHFYHLLRRRYLLSVLCLVCSLDIVLEGLSIFSRSSVIYYLMLYTFYLPFFAWRFERGQRRLVGAVGLAVMTAFGAVFYQITNNRFGGYLSSGDARFATAAIENAELYSILDYASQWYKNGNYVLARYSFQTFHGALSFPIVETIANKAELTKTSPDMVPDQLEGQWGDRYDKFVGLIPNLVFDFGYAGTVIFVLLYQLLLRSVRPVRGALSIGGLLVLGPLFLLPAMGTQNSMMKLAGYNLMIAYAAAVYAYLYSRRRAAVQLQPVNH